MKKRKFNPHEWVPKPVKRNAVKRNRPVLNSSSPIENEVEVVLGRVEENHLDLTCCYDDWLKMGFAFASEFGQAGRDYFHRVSRFHPAYDPKKCDYQFDNCLQGRKSGITIKSFFAAAYYAGINVKV